jgi:RNA polymerase sigma factor (sigma-70 family)
MRNGSKILNDIMEENKYAISRIYCENVKLLYCYGKKFTKDDELVKDTIQELFFDLIRNRKNLSTVDNIRYYLFKSLRRKLLRELNSSKKIFITYEYNELTDATIVFSYEEELINKENRSQNEELILKAFNKISSKQREILYYRFTCNFDYEQICEIMSMKYDSARKMVFRALNSLREHLQETDFLI